ncbi:hypothetical protein PV11_06581 [Exophiala sideris]|uniref:Uncharacterized protein n=1 Tax=Exophiala sideris TaxID=1016849 RepID=A0A0D1WUW5_9EURO|nr:hypothetical protein PV11_06581 [Exophiala sideris]
MPPQEDGTPRAFTWITGDPRSRQNVTQIRRHAGQNPGGRVATALRASADHNQASSVHGRVYLAPAPVASAQVPGTVDTSTKSKTATASSSAHIVYPATRPPGNTTPIPTSFAQVLYPITRPPEHITSTSSTTKAPVRRLAIDELVNPSDEQDGEHISVLSASSTAVDVGWKSNEPAASFDEHQGSTLSHYAAGKQREDATQSNKRTSELLEIDVLQANVSKRRKPVSSSSSKVSWRLGMAPAPKSPLALSKDDSQMEQILLHTREFYTGTFESTWSARLQQDGTAFDIISTVETFSGSITTAAGLIAVNRIDSASSILNRVLPSLHQLLTSPHPQLYYVLAELSLDGSDSDLARLRFQIKHFAADVSEGVLGAHHPITQLLRMRLPDTTTVRLRELIQAEIHRLHEQLFGGEAYQTTCQEYFLARILSQLGRPDDAVRILAGLLSRCEKMYGADSLMCVTAMLELAKVHLAQSQCHGERHGQGQGVAYEQAESLANDALRRTFRIQTDNQVRLLSAGIMHSRMACLRTLGRVHSLRHNHGGALQYYARAVKVGVDELGPTVPATQLALADLDQASKMAATTDTPGILGPPLRAFEMREMLDSLTSINTTAVS